MTENLELIALSMRVSAYAQTLPRAFTACIYTMDEDEDSDQNLDL